METSIVSNQTLPIRPISSHLYFWNTFMPLLPRDCLWSQGIKPSLPRYCAHLAICCEDFDQQSRMASPLSAVKPTKIDPVITSCQSLCSLGISTSLLVLSVMRESQLIDRWWRPNTDWLIQVGYINLPATKKHRGFGYRRQFKATHVTDKSHARPH